MYKPRPARDLLVLLLYSKPVYLSPHFVTLPPYLMNCNTPYALMYNVRLRVSQRLKHTSPVTKVKHRKAPIVCSADSIECSIVCC